MERSPEASAQAEAFPTWRWLARSKYKLMGELIQDVQAGKESEEKLRARYDHTLVHGERVLRVRLVVTILLFLGAGAAAASAIAERLMLGGVLAQVVAWSASVSVLLLLLRLAFDRYLQRIDVVATYLALQISQRTRP